MSFVDDVNQEQERNSPVRAVVKANAADIQAALAAGKPLNAVYRTLRRKGQAVGKGYSSFRAAVRYLDRHGWPNGASVKPVVASPASAIAAADTSPAPVPRDRFADDRNPSDF